MISPDSKIFVAGHRGLVGSAPVRCLDAKGYGKPVLRAHHELDLTDGHAVAESSCFSARIYGSP